MARLNCPDCPKTFKGEGGLEWHMKRSHPTSSSADGAAVTAIIGQEPPEIASAGPEPALVRELQEKIAELERELDQTEGTMQAMLDSQLQADKELTTLHEAEAHWQGEKAAWQEEKVTMLAYIEALQVGPHPYGLCGNVGCEACVSQGQEVMLLGRHTVLDEIDTALEWAGGSALRERIAAIVQRWQDAGKPAPTSEPTLAITAEAARPLDLVQAAPRVRDRRAENVANPELYTGVPDPTPKAVVPAHLSQSFLDTILHSAVSTAVSIGVARAMNPSHPQVKEEVAADKPAENAPTFVEGDQGHLDPEFLRALMEDLDRILRDPDKMGEVDVATLRVTRE